MARPGLTGHRKFRRLARTLGSPIVARGVLELLWEHCYESGDDYVGMAEDIEAMVGWTGERGLLTRALVEAGAPEGHGFIEPAVDASDDTPTRREAETRYRVHDLWHHAPDYVKKRRERELQRQEKVAPILTEDRRSGAERRRTAPLLDCQDGDVRPPSPSPSPSHEEDASRTASADAVVNLWNQLVTPPIPKVTRLTASRRTKIDARLKAFPDLATWTTAIAWVNGQDWCRAPGTGQHPNWTATLDWFVRSDDQMQRVLERLDAAAAPRTGPRSVDPVKLKYGKQAVAK